MYSNEDAINEAYICNSVNSKAFSLANQRINPERDCIINNYSQSFIDNCWQALSVNVIQNYQRGKGTSIKGFGVFTFKSQEVSLEGTTNPFVRDKKFKVPVFIVSKELNEKFCAGEFTRQNGIRYYTQKESKDVSIVRLNLAEIAYSLSMPKDEVKNIYSHLFQYLSETIINGTFRNKILPGLGVLVNRGNVIAVNFNESFVQINKGKNQKSVFTKKNVFLDMNMDYAQDTTADKCLTPYRNIEDLKAKNALITRCTKNAKEFLNTNYSIDVSSLPKHELKPIHNENQKTNSFSFINDDFNLNYRNKYNKNFGGITNNSNDFSSKNYILTEDQSQDLNSPLNNLDDDTLKTVEYFKGMMIKNCKGFDPNGTGVIGKNEAINALVKTNINNKFDYNLAKIVVDGFNKTENVEYMKFIAQLVKMSRLALLKRKKNSFTQNNNNKTANMFNGKKNIKGSFSSINPNGMNATNRSLGNKSEFSKTFGSGFFHNQKKVRSVSKNMNHNLTEGDYLNEEEKNSSSQRNQSAKSENKNLSFSKNNNNNLFTRSQKNFFSDRQKETEECKQRLATIVNLLPELRRKYYTSLDQKISCEEFMNILSHYNVYYPKPKIYSLLDFLGIPDKEAFTLREFHSYVCACKIITASIGLNELNNIMKKLKDIIYINGGEKFLFNNEINPNSTIDCNTFIKILGEKIPSISSDILRNVYIYLVKTDRLFDKNDYINYFENPETKITFDEIYCLNMMRKVIQRISDMHLKADEYFEHLILNNVSSLNKVITRLDWIKFMQKEKLKFSAEELDNLFKWIDYKKDGIIDKEEFVTKFNHTIKPLTIIQDIVLTNKLDIEDLAHRMNINMHEIQNYDFETFRQKIKLLNYTYPDDFIKKIFNELLSLSKDEKLKQEKKVSSKQFLDEINYIKPPENYKSFIQNYMNVVRSKISHDDLKAQLEKFDKDSLGYLTKLEYVSAVTNILPEFTDEDHMRFIRVTDMFDKQGNIDYPEMLNLIFFYNKEKLNDPFTKLCQILTNLLQNECEGDVERLMYLVTTGSTKKTNSLVLHKPLTVKEVKDFMNKIKNPAEEKIIQKLDIDADGMISFNDLRGVLKRFHCTSYFKYVNDSNDPNICLFSKETMTETKFRVIIKKIKHFMKLKNLTVIGLFKKFDVDDDGFISSIDFNSAINDIIPMSPAVKDQFFNCLDFYHNGLVDLETFIIRMQDFASANILVQNNNKIENEILEKLREFVIKNNKLSDNEIFSVIDKDCDGLISLEDFKNFIKHNLCISEIEFNKSKLERVMMSLSLSKNLQIGLNDIREFINLCNENKSHMNLKEVFKITTNQNLSDLKLNKEWTNDIIERLGMFVSEKYDSIEQFFMENSEQGSNKFKFSDFIKFHEKNYELFNNGFNLTKDELLSIFTSLDSQKKNFLTLQDLKNKLQIFNFYNKMHIDVKNFIQENFTNGVDAFKFFSKSKNILNSKEDSSELNDPEKCFITLKEFFDAFENFFPNKYPTNTILKYLNKYFNISIISNNQSKNKNDLLNKKDTIGFSEFNYVYFDTFKKDTDFIYDKNSDTKLMTNRLDIQKKIPNDLTQKSQNNFYYSNLFKKKFESLSTPFDTDPLNKIKRILCSSKYDLNKFFETAAIECGNDNYIVNKYQFRNIIKQLDIGLTNLEIDQIMFKCGKISYNGNLNLREFIRFLYTQNYTLEEGKENVGKIMGIIKSLIYKYYSNPIICFENNDTNHTGKIDFEKFKNIIFDMFRRNEAKMPNFTLIKNAFDTIDLRKDGVIDMNEWCKSFASYNGSLDVYKENVTNGLEFFDKKFMTKNNFRNPNKISHNRKILREWETSGDVTEIYKFINKNRKLIKKELEQRNYILGSDGIQMVHGDNLIDVLKDIMPTLRLSHTQWKMIANVALQNERTDGLIDVNDFFRLMEITAKNLVTHPTVFNRSNSKKRLRLESSYGSFSNNYSNNGKENCWTESGYKTMGNGFYHRKKRPNSIMTKSMNGMMSGNIKNKKDKSQGKFFNMKAIA